MTGNTTASRSCRQIVLKATLQPAIGLPKRLAKLWDFVELLNPATEWGGDQPAYRDI